MGRSATPSRAPFRRRPSDRARPRRRSDGGFPRRCRSGVARGDGRDAAARRAARRNRPRRCPRCVRSRASCAAWDRTHRDGRGDCSDLCTRWASSSSMEMPARPRGSPDRLSIRGCPRRRPPAERSVSCSICSPTATVGRFPAAAWGNYPPLCSGAPGARGHESAATAVEQILLSGNRVSGVRIASGESIAADGIISTVSVGVLTRLLPGHELAAALSGWRYGTARSSWTMPLTGPYPGSPRSRAAPPSSISARHSRSWWRPRRQAGAARVPPRPAVVVGQQTLLDPAVPRQASTRCTPTPTYPPITSCPTRTWPRTSRLRSSASPLASRSLCSRARCDRRVSPSRRTPAWSAATSPAAPTSLTSSSVFRPSPLLSRYRTPIRGLFVAGASTHPGGAIHGVSGRGAALALLRDSKLIPRFETLARR